MIVCSVPLCVGDTSPVYESTMGGFYGKGHPCSLLDVGLTYTLTCVPIGEFCVFCLVSLIGLLRVFSEYLALGNHSVSLLVLQTGLLCIVLAVRELSL